ncbi:cation diffusion facilitator family transporter [Marinicella sp. S1101]|uniref:cation diffusion facilitator family transporter n=1 Tax=Marinicella marina TaxID=2996016 RepID=UPI002260F998|nr:cation diffusion facilitator family transporter [Marinicella marina]MCX7554826.1 cation diffusion facilitator family transporter [Marinicella marina]MDJ1140941.1 cation diffusion facilitator family transporter [Marinicella marina]
MQESNTKKDKKVQQIIMVEGFYNVVVLVLKLIVGLTTNSLAIISDAIHSLTDVLNNVVIWMVMRVAGKPADKEHPYGHRKFETIAVFALASLLVVLAVQLIIQAFTSDTNEITNEAWGLVLMLLVLAMNFSVSMWERNWAKKLNSDILHADAQHTLVDVLTTFLVIISWQLSAMGLVWLDKLCAIAVALLVFYFAFGLFQKVIPILVDGFAIDPTLLSKEAEQVNGVKTVRKVRSRWIGNNKAVDLIITVDASLNITDSHDIAHAVEDLLVARFNVADVSIHVEPHQDDDQ